MFKSTLWNGTIWSDEGFSVRLLSRNYLRYTEGAICFEAFWEAAAGAATLGVALMDCETWLEVGVQEDERARIVGNIRRALKSKGWAVTLIGQLGSSQDAKT